MREEWLSLRTSPGALDQVPSASERTAGRWRVFKKQLGFRDEEHAQIGLARSRGGIGGWKRHPGNPILRPGRNRWDHDAVYKPFAVLAGGRRLLW